MVRSTWIWLCIFPTAVAAQTGSTTEDAIVPNDLAPPVGITLILGYPGNVPQSELEEYVAQTLVPASHWLWKTTKGLVYIHKAVFKLNVDIDDDDELNQLDGLILDESGPSEFAVGPSEGWTSVDEDLGRQGRLMGVNSEPGDFDTFLHELGHLIFKTAYFYSYTLDDEYMYEAADGTSSPIEDGNLGEELDPCIMDLGFSPRGFCWSYGDHEHKARGEDMEDGEVSCWQGILAAYPAFAGVDPTDPDPVTTPPALEVDYPGDSDDPDPTPSPTGPGDPTPSPNPAGPGESGAESTNETAVAPNAPEIPDFDLPTCGLLGFETLLVLLGLALFRRIRS